MIKYFLIVVMTILCGSATSQDVASLNVELANAKHDTTRVRILVELSNICELDEIKSYALQAAEIAEKGIVKSSALKPVYLPFLADSYNNLGYAYKQEGDFVKALESYYKGIQVYEKIDKKLEQGYCLNNIGQIQDELGNYQEALKNYQAGLELFSFVNDSSGLGMTYNNLGVTYNNLRDIDLALFYYEKCADIRIKTGQERGLGAVWSNLGTLYYELDSNERAMDYFEKSLEIRERINDQKGIAHTLSQLSALYLEMGQLKSAQTAAERSFELSSSLGFPDLIRSSARVLKDVYHTKRDYKRAYEMFELESAMKDSLKNEAIRRSAIQQEFQYEYEKKSAADSITNAKEHEIKNAALAQQQAELKAKKNQQIALFGGLIIVLVFGALMFNRFRVTQKQKRIIELQKTEVEVQREFALHQKKLVEEKHKEITDSINYAERIQRSFLATKDLLDEYLKDYFVLFQPKDVVSGDFYWASALKNNNFALVTADSTGHGVPGAIMSILNISSLEKAVESGLCDPAEIFNHTRQTIIERLKKDGSKEGGKDGMDASLVCFDFKNGKLNYAAANNPLWIVRASTAGVNELIECVPDKMPVGKHDKQTILFTSVQIDIVPGDVIYTFTDGLPDQFGGEKGKKFMYKRFKEFLVSIASDPMAVQHEKLKNYFTDWKGDLEQVDDVCVIGVRV